MQLRGAGHHLRRQAIRGGAGQAVLHAAVCQRLQEHGGEGGAAPGDGAGGREQMARNGLDERDAAEQPGERFPFIGGERVLLLAGDHAAAHGDRRVGDGGKVVAAGA